MPIVFTSGRLTADTSGDYTKKTLRRGSNNSGAAIGTRTRDPFLTMGPAYAYFLFGAAIIPIEPKNGIKDCSHTLSEN